MVHAYRMVSYCRSIGAAEAGQRLRNRESASGQSGTLDHLPTDAGGGARGGAGPMWPRPRSTGPAWPRRVSSPVWQRRGSGAVVLLLLLATLRRRPRQGPEMPVCKGAQSLDLGEQARLRQVRRRQVIPSNSRSSPASEAAAGHPEQARRLQVIPSKRGGGRSSRASAAAAGHPEQARRQVKKNDGTSNVRHAGRKQ
jgi:hypothetical protein